MQNREIKFRGFDKLHSTWIYGDLIRIPTDGGDYNTPPSSELTTYVTNSHVLTHEWVEVEPNSVGQFSGLPDKNGKPIYEGDLLKDDHTLFKVVFHSSGWNLNRISGCYQSTYFHSNCKRMEIIGNLYENHDLLT